MDRFELIAAKLADYQKASAAADASQAQMNAINAELAAAQLDYNTGLEGAMPGQMLTKKARDTQNAQIANINNLKASCAVEQQLATAAQTAKFQAHQELLQAAYAALQNPTPNPI
jgi:hypothetical protein